MSLFIASGTNLGDKLLNLKKAETELNNIFSLVAASRIYESPAVDYLFQPNFYNQVLEFKTPNEEPLWVMKKLLALEEKIGRAPRNASSDKGPRLIDLDLLFWNDLTLNTDSLTIPHPRVFQRSFVVLPLSELPGFKILERQFQFSFVFENFATPLSY